MDIDFAEEEERRKPLWRRLGFWKLASSALFTLTFAVAGALMAVFQEDNVGVGGGGGVHARAHVCSGVRVA